MARFHSARFSLSLPFPDGPRWRIDDHKTAMLRATHAATESVVELVMWHEEELMNRAKCEERAREKGFGERAGDEVEDETAQFPAGWDTRVWIGAEQDANKTSTGHLFAFASFIRKCLYFHFATKNASIAVVSDRLALARLRVFGEVRLDSFDVAREKH